MSTTRRSDRDVGQSGRPGRRSIRLRGFDYASQGAYFVTICIKNRECVLGEVVEGDVHLSPAGFIVSEAWSSMAQRFETVDVSDFVVMPNHLHGIVMMGDGHGKGTTVSAVVQAFKSLSTIAVNRHLGTVGKPLWQRNFYETVIRDDEHLATVRMYIEGNPTAWGHDAENRAPAHWHTVRVGMKVPAPAQAHVGAQLAVPLRTRTNRAGQTEPSATPTRTMHAPFRKVRIVSSASNLLRRAQQAVPLPPAHLQSVRVGGKAPSATQAPVGAQLAVPLRTRTNPSKKTAPFAAQAPVGAQLAVPLCTRTNPSKKTAPQTTRATTMPTVVRMVRLGPTRSTLGSRAQQAVPLPPAHDTKVHLWRFAVADIGTGQEAK